MAEGLPLNLDLMIDSRENRVVFAECNKDFVDIIFSFLTLPMGTAVRLLGKQSRVGCMDKLYESVENLDADLHFQTEACKTMLLQPRSAAEQHCKKLLININDLDPNIYYRCTDWNCFTNTGELYSLVFGSRCCCGRQMVETFHCRGLLEDQVVHSLLGDGVFVRRGDNRFIVTDDLQVFVVPDSLFANLELLQNLGIQDVKYLERKTIRICSKIEVLSLLSRTLISKTPLTDVFLRNGGTAIDDSEQLDQVKHTPITEMDDVYTTTSGSNLLFIRLIKTRDNDEVVRAYAEGLVDLLFSFLTFPLGAIIYLLNKEISLGCVVNLYESVRTLSTSDDNCLRSKECQSMLLVPKLASFFGCNNNLLRIGESQPIAVPYHSCESCRIGETPNCGHYDLLKPYFKSSINPKLPISWTVQGGGYTKPSVTFMISDEMIITPISAPSNLPTIRSLEESTNNLVVEDEIIGEVEALALLKACLICRTAVTSVFSTRKCVQGLENRDSMS